MSQFVQLSTEDTTYLLNLIEEIDADTVYTARQRAYTVPKLQRIANDPRSARLAYQDVDYLLELLEDDDLTDAEQPGIEQQRAMTQGALLEIQQLQAQRASEIQNIEDQRAARKARRRPLGVPDLQEHFEQVSVKS